MAEEEEEDGGDGMLVFAISSLISHLLCQPCGKDISSAAGFITSELFYTDDNGTYIFPTRDFHPEIEINDGEVDLEEFLSVHKKRIQINDFTFLGQNLTWRVIIRG